MPYSADQHEKEVLEFWKENRIFEHSVESRPENKPYVFYDGPPFATGLPHYGHILSSVIKDIIPRYKTMRGYRVRRRWGWDCHGLPIEQLIEKELEISGKKDIETKLGIDKFNEACRSKVLTYTSEWKSMVDRIGRWVEFENSYKTMDSTYMESVWWALKTIWDKGLIYEGRKVLMYCPRCETPVSKAEIAMDNSYKDITEETAVAKFKVKNPEKHNLPENTFLLAWTTTPWTLPGNVALAVGNDIEYVLVKASKYYTYSRINTPGLSEQMGKREGEEQYFILAKNRKEEVLEKLDGAYTEEKGFKGSQLVGIEYEPLFDMPAMLATGKKAYYVAAADFVTTEEGTGIVHTAVIYGEDDYNLGVKLDLPMVPMLDEGGNFTDVVPENIRGQYFKKAEKEIKRDLDARGLLFAKEQHTHSYPHCWRCDTQLFYNAISAWFINIQKVKDRMIELNQKISWFPEHLKNGRFLNILETAPDWNISRNRYWATPLPFWRCTSDGCTNVTCVGSVAELKGKALNFDQVYKTDVVEEIDLHKHRVDEVVLRCDACSGEMHRIPEVIDCWVESGSMPFAEFHYPFENKEVFEKRFPGQFIAEYIAQTRAWFYYMHAIGALLFDNISFEHVVCTGTILNEKGEKLSKSKRNYTDPWLIIEQYGVDALRYYLMSSPVMQSENLFFNDREVRDVYNKVINILWNVVEFYRMYVGETDVPAYDVHNSKHLLDRWIVSRLHELIREVTAHFDYYDTVRASRPIKDFIDDLSTWYVRRSRDRFKSDDEQDKDAAIGTLRYVLQELSKLMAPVTPFIAEKIHQTVSPGGDSVHLEMWPEYDESLVTQAVLDEMLIARKVVEMGLSLRKEAGIRVRQPLRELSVSRQLSEAVRQIIAEELNVKQVSVSQMPEESAEWARREEGELIVALQTSLDEELKNEGVVRELIRAINQIRKEQKLTPTDQVAVLFETGDSDLRKVILSSVDEIKKQVAAQGITEGVGEVLVEGVDIKIAVQKI